ncbi:hypothetical protein HYU91_02325 [Candidatus Collierbacteria bacterium]|nr:hypothetical protein [Candidatus Collierbacteria bacterium]
MVNLVNAVRQTRKYAAYFHSHLDNEGLHHWLISEKIVSKKRLARFPQKLSKRQLHDIQMHQEISKLKIEKARRIAHFLSYFPTISLIAVTGSLAVANARVDDDLDLFIITRANALWLTRAFVIPLISIFYKRRKPFAIRDSLFAIRDAVCLNLWLDESALAVPESKRSLYTAHEVLQAKPIFDRGDTYAKFIRSNEWTKKYLANAYCHSGLDPESIQIDSHFRGNDNTIRLGMIVFLRILNSFAFRLQYSYMKSKITRETITLHSAYFHPNDYASIDLGR